MSKNEGTRPHIALRFLDLPEVNVAIFSFLLNFVWEFLQVPTYAGMASLGHWQGVRVCLDATIGDVGFSLTAFWFAALAARSRYWIVKPRTGPVAVYLLVGVFLTVGFEYYYVEVTHRWAYSAMMPRVPPFGTGLSPLLQWLILPLLTVWFAYRQIRHIKPAS